MDVVWIYTHAKNLGHLNLALSKDWSKNIIQNLYSEEYLWADYELYNHFNNKFQQKLENFGEFRLKQELSLLEKENNKTKVKY